MSLGLRQFFKVTDKLLGKMLKRGKSVDPTVLADLALQYRYKPGKPFTQPAIQSYKQTFDVESYNKMLEQLSDDMSVLFEEYTEDISSVIGMLAVSETLSDFYKHQIKQLQDTVESLILLTPGNDIAMMVYDSFIDASKIDQYESNVALMLQNQSVMLRLLPDAVRLPLSHLLGRKNPGVRFSEPKAAIRTSLGGLSDIITDTVAGWAFTVQSNEPAGLRATIDIPLTEDKSNVYWVSRVDMEPLATSDQWVQVYGSSEDMVNFTVFGDYTAFRPFVSKRLTWTFPKKKLRYLRIELSKSAPDAKTGGDSFQYLYNFGIKLLAAYKQGFAKESILVSKALAPAEVSTDRPITRVTIEADEDLPAGTDIRYEISPDGGESFAPITPINRNADAAAPIVSFDSPTHASQQIAVAATPPIAGNVHGRNFYTLYEFPGPPIKGSVKVQRGLYAWTKEEYASRTERRKLINYITFDPNALQNGTGNTTLYVIERETTGKHAGEKGVLATPIEVRYPFAGGKAAAVAPPEWTGADYPQGLVLKMWRHMGTDIFCRVTSTGGARIQLPVTITKWRESTKEQESLYPVRIYIGDAANKFTTLAANLQPFGNVAAREVYELIGQRFTFEFTNNQGRTASGSVVIHTAEVNQDGALVLTVDDPTRLLFYGPVDFTGGGNWFIECMSVQNYIVGVQGQSILLSPLQPIVPTDRFEVEYLRRLLSSEHVLLDSVRARPRTRYVEEVEVNGKVDQRRVDEYEHGVDFKILDNGNVIRLAGSRIPEDPDKYGGVVIIKFKLETELVRPSVYTTNVYVEGPEIKVIPLTPVTLNTDYGEEAYVGSQKLDGVSKITLAPGWHKVTVKSRSLRNLVNDIDRGSAIYRVINIQDNRGRYIFPAYRQQDMTADPSPPAFASYFTKQSAFHPDRLAQVTMAHLSSGVKPDDMSKFFAVKEPDEIIITAETQAIIGWNPFTTEELLVYPPDVSGTTEPSNIEMFIVSYDIMVSEPNVSSVVLKATLSRSDDPSVSPALNGYTVRFGF